MAGRTSRFKLNRFGGGTQGTISDDGQKYTGVDRDTIDRLLAQTEMHTHRVQPTSGGLNTPATAVLQTGGTLEAGLDYHYRYSVLDANGMESVAAPLVTVSTPELLPVPGMPGAYVNAADSGQLPPGQYYYAITALRGTEETPISAATSITVIAGESAVRVTLPALGSAESFRIWRMGRLDAGFTKIGTSSTAEFFDDGSVAANPAAGQPQNLPPQTNTGVANYAVEVTLPAGVDLSTATGWRLYRAVQYPTFPTNALVHQVVERQTEWDPTTPLLRSWTDTGDAALPGTPSNDDLNMRFQPFVLDSAALAPDPAGYPENYPMLIAGKLNALVSGVWTPIGSSGSGGGSTAAPVVGPAPVWYVNDLHDYAGGASGLGNGASTSTGGPAGALTLETVDVPAGRTKAVRFNVGANLNDYAEIFWNGFIGGRDTKNLSVRVLYKFLGAAAAAPRFIRSSTSAVVATLPESGGYAWSPWIDLGSRTLTQPDARLKVIRTATGGTITFLVAGIEFMNTEHVGTVEPADGYLSDVPNRGIFAFDYAANVWKPRVIAPISVATSYGSWSDDLFQPTPGATDYMAIPLPPTDYFNNANAAIEGQSKATPREIQMDLKTVNIAGWMPGLEIRCGRADYRVIVEATVSPLSPGDVVRTALLRDSSAGYRVIDVNPQQDAVCPPGQTSLNLRAEFTVNGIVERGVSSAPNGGLVPAMRIFSAGAPVVTTFGVTVEVSQFHDAYPLPDRLPITASIAAASGAAGQIAVTFGSPLLGPGKLTVINTTTGAAAASAAPAAGATTYTFTGVPTGNYVVAIEDGNYADQYRPTASDPLHVA